MVHNRRKSIGRRGGFTRQTRSAEVSGNGGRRGQRCENLVTEAKVAPSSLSVGYRLREHRLKIFLCYSNLSLPSSLLCYPGLLVVLVYGD